MGRRPAGRGVAIAALAVVVIGGAALAATHDFRVAYEDQHGSTFLDLASLRPHANGTAEADVLSVAMVFGDGLKPAWREVRNATLVDCLWGLVGTVSAGSGQHRFTAEAADRGVVRIACAPAVSGSEITLDSVEAAVAHARRRLGDDAVPTPPFRAVATERLPLGQQFVRAYRDGAAGRSIYLEWSSRKVEGEFRAYDSLWVIKSGRGTPEVMYRSILINCAKRDRMAFLREGELHRQDPARRERMVQLDLMRRIGASPAASAPLATACAHGPGPTVGDAAGAVADSQAQSA